MKPRAVVLLSGGMDSAVAAALAREAGFALYALSFDYGQRQRVELTAAARVAAWLEVVEHKVMRIELEKVAASALTSPAVPVPPAGGEGIPGTYVPARNLIFLSIALAWAETLSAERVVLGVNAVDFSGYPDCRPEFISAFQAAALAGTKAGAEGRRIEIWAPLLHRSKAEIVQEGRRLSLDFRLTHSCYNPAPDGQACGRCDACRLREKGMVEAGLLERGE